MGEPPSGRSGHSMATVGSKVFVLGGESSTDTSREENPSIVHVLETSKRTPRRSTVYADSLCVLKDTSSTRIHRSHRLAGRKGQGVRNAARLLKLSLTGPSPPTAVACPTPRISAARWLHHLPMPVVVPMVTHRRKCSHSQLLASHLEESPCVHAARAMRHMA